MSESRKFNGSHLGLEVCTACSSIALCGTKLQIMLCNISIGNYACIYED